MTSGIGFSPGVLVSEPASPFPPSPSLPAYRWVWPDATARLAQAVTAAQVGGTGFQTDIERAFTLYPSHATTPQWRELDDGLWAAQQKWSAVQGSSAFVTGSNVVGDPALTLTAGTATLRLPTTTTRSSGLIRVAALSLAVPGSVGAWQAAALTPLPFTFGLRRHMRCVFAPSANYRMFLGMCPATTYTALNVDPAALLNIVGIGRTAQANLQFYSNNGAGAAAAVDLGAGFPAATTTGLELDLWTFTGATWFYFVRNLDTLGEASGAVSAKVPVTSSLMGVFAYANNSTDAVAVASELSVIDTYQQISA